MIAWRMSERPWLVLKRACGSKKERQYSVLYGIMSRIDLSPSLHDTVLEYDI